VQVQFIRMTADAVASHDSLSYAPLRPVQADLDRRTRMQRYFGALTVVLLVGMVCVRTLLMKRAGIKAMHFGMIDKKDFLIPPFALFYFYLVFAAAFHLPTVSRQEFFHSEIASLGGLFFCLAGLLLLFLSLVSFGRSFRVGIDADRPDKLVTTGIFAYSRNPIYVAFGFVLIGQFLIFSNWILLVYMPAAVWLFHRQIAREEEFLRSHYGRQYEEYCARVRRYL
jgi:protein-S-isoprenylcysteine O-methyltransferase Ste14